MKESNIIVNNVANNSLFRGVLRNIKKQFMKESNMLVYNAADIFSKVL